MLQNPYTKHVVLLNSELGKKEIRKTVPHIGKHWHWLTLGHIGTH